MKGCPLQGDMTNGVPVSKSEQQEEWTDRGEQGNTVLGPDM